MRVWSETTGTVTLAMEDLSSIPPGAGATRYIDDTQDVTGGQWNDGYDVHVPCCECDRR